MAPRRFAWQAWHLATSTFTLRGRCGTWRHPPSLCVARRHAWHWAGSGGALGFRCDAVAPRRFAWQAWHLAISFTLRGRRGMVTSTALCVAHRHFAWAGWAGSGGALGFRCDAVAPRRFAWQAWHLATSTFTLRGRCGTWRHPPSLCVARMARMALGWLWWCAWF